MRRPSHLVCLVLLLGACQNPHNRSAGQLVGGYLADRAGDIIDIVALDVGIGGWLGARVHVGQLAHLGLGYEDADRYGWHYGEWLDGRPESHFYPPASFIDTGGHDTVIPPLHHGARKVPPSEMHEPAPGHACWFLFPFLCDQDLKEPASEGILWGLDVEASVQAPGIGIRVGVSPGEALDFVAGIFGLDLAGDDTLSRPPDP
jgi:hypothetical protein